VVVVGGVILVLGLVPLGVRQVTQVGVPVVAVGIIKVLEVRGAHMDMLGQMPGGSLLLDLALAGAVVPGDKVMQHMGRTVVPIKVALAGRVSPQQ